MKRLLFGLFLLACLATALCAGAYLYLNAYRQRSYSIDTSGTVEIKKGLSSRRIIEQLAQQGIIRRPAYALLCYRLFYRGRTLKAGFYTFSSPVSLDRVLGKLVSGREAFQQITIVEGWSLADIGQALADSGVSGAQGFEALARDQAFLRKLDVPFPSLEGAVFPETYHFPLQVDVATVVHRAISRSRTEYGRLSKHARNPMPYAQAVTLASLVEKEAAVAAEAPIIASVYLNRLAINMRLECDPTVIYALQRKGLYRGTLLRKDMGVDDPYNTYRYPGLPPGTICSPGRVALKAVLYPADTPYFYFVAKNNREHAFARTYKEHVRNIRTYRR